MIKRITLILLVFLSVKSIAQFGPQQIITTDIANPWSVYAADMDGDGDMDILSASEGDDTLAWYENLDALGNFGPKQIITQTLDQTRFVIAADLDGDGDMDVLSLSLASDLIVWYENLDGMGTFGTVNLISNQADLAQHVVAVDLNGDGDLDVLSASSGDNKIAWYENTDGQGNFGPQQIISSNALSPFSVFTTDLDGDNDMDVITTSAGDKRLYWYENLDGLGNFGPGNIIVETPGFGGFVSVFSIDIDGDNDMDVLSVEFGGGRIAWYENTDGLGAFGPQQIITDEIEDPFRIFAIDLDNDGDNDVLSLSFSGDIVVWFENTDGLGTFGPLQIITTNTDTPLSVYATDLDNDGDNDVLSASLIDNKIAWYENYTILGVAENPLQEVIIYPNPVKDILTIKVNNTTKINSVKIYNTLGQLVLEKNGGFTQIDVSNMYRGLFFVSVETEIGVLTKKIIKQ